MAKTPEKNIGENRKRKGAEEVMDFYLKLGYLKEGKEFEEVTIKHWAMRKML